jgi:membrane fusion protein (multidrug efflux system)
VAAANLNRSRLKRSEELLAKNFISAQAMDETRENLNQSVAREAEIKAKLAKSTIRAPFEGVTGLRQVSPGAYAKAGQDIARLEGIGVLKLDFRVPEAYLRRIRVGQPLVINVDAYPGESFNGSIYAIEPAVDESTRTVLLRARLPNPGVRLKPGMFARVNLDLERRENALLIPEQAIVPRGDGRFVFRIAEGKAQLVKVEMGARRPGEVEILKGLEAGDTIVVDGQLKLQDGAAVSVPGDKPAAKK